MIKLVYDIAAESGGAITILDSYYENAKADINNNYVFFVSQKKYINQKNIVVLCFPWVKKSWLHRLYFDLIFSKKEMRKFEFDSVISLQNALVPHTNKEQVVYFHNSLFISKYKINILLNPKLWFYKNVYSQYVFYSLKKAKTIIVQAKWICDILAKKLSLDESRIHVKKPFLTWTNDFSGYSISKIAHDSIIVFFYPSSPVEFKNIKLIINSMKKVSKNLYRYIKILITVNPNDNHITKKMFTDITNNKLPIEFIGYISKKDVYNIYVQSTLIFPSLVESAPLPLIEAAHLNRDIIVSNLPYAVEMLDGYKNVKYFNPNSSGELSWIISKYVELRLKSRA